jgi:hypothetical protein
MGKKKWFSNLAIGIQDFDRKEKAALKLSIGIRDFDRKEKVVLKTPLVPGCTIDRAIKKPQSVNDTK